MIYLKRVKSPVESHAGLRGVRLRMFLTDRDVQAMDASRAGHELSRLYDCHGYDVSHWTNNFVVVLVACICQ